MRWRVGISRCLASTSIVASMVVHAFNPFRYKDHVIQSWIDNPPRYYRDFSVVDMLLFMLSEACQHSAEGFKLDSFCTTLQVLEKPLGHSLDHGSQLVRLLLRQLDILLDSQCLSKSRELTSADSFITLTVVAP